MIQFQTTKGMGLPPKPRLEQETSVSNGRNILQGDLLASDAFGEAGADDFEEELPLGP